VSINEPVNKIIYGYFLSKILFTPIDRNYKEKKVYKWENGLKIIIFNTFYTKDLRTQQILNAKRVFNKTLFSLKIALQQQHFSKIKETNLETTTVYFINTDTIPAG